MCGGFGFALLIGCAESGDASNRTAPTATSASASGGSGAGEQGGSIPRPELNSLASAARQQIEQAFSRVEAATTAEARAEALGGLALACHAHKLVDCASAAYEQVRLLEPQSFRWVYLHSHVHAAAGRNAESIAALERAVQIDPLAWPAVLSLAEAYLDDGQSAPAAGLLQRARNEETPQARVLAGLARVAQAQGELESAARLYEQALELEPEADGLHYPLSQLYRKLGRRDQARAALERRGEGRPRRIDSWLAEVARLAQGERALIDRGLAAARQGALDQAVAAFRQALEQAPEDTTARLYLASTLHLHERWDEAAALYQQVARDQPHDDRPHYGLGVLWAQRGDDEQAAAAFAAALGRNPALRQAALALGRTLQRLGRNEEALQRYRAVLEVDPLNPEARFGRAFSLVRLGRWAAARDALDNDITALPSQPAFRHALARLLASAPDNTVRDGARALELVREVAALMQNADVAETIAMALAETGDRAQARLWQERALAAARQAGDERLVRRRREQLQAYADGRPWRAPWDSADPIFSPPQPPLPLPG